MDYIERHSLATNLRHNINNALVLGFIQLL